MSGQYPRAARHLTIESGRHKTIEIAETENDGNKEGWGTNMGLSMVTKLQLMAYTDGELSQAEIEEVEGLLSRDVAARQFVSAISEPAIGAFIRANEAARVVPSVVDSVMARIESESATQVSNVVPFSARKRSNRVAFAAMTITTVSAIAASALVYVGVSRYSAVHEGNSPIASAAPFETDDGKEIEVVSPSQVSVLEPGRSTPGMSAAVAVWFDEDDDDDETPGGDR